MLDGLQQLRVFLTHDLGELRRAHPGLLHLLEGTARVHGLMLAGVPDNEDAVL